MNLISLYPDRTARESIDNFSKIRFLHPLSVVRDLLEAKNRAEIPSRRKRV